MPFPQPLLNSDDQPLLAYRKAMCSRSNKGAGTAELFDPEGQVIYALYHPANSSFCNHKPSAPNLRRPEVLQTIEPVPNRINQPAFGLLYAPGKLGLRLDYDFGGGTGRWRAQIRNEIAN